jgi:ATP-binding cassette subfamily C protein LapB
MSQSDQNENMKEAQNEGEKPSFLNTADDVSEANADHHDEDKTLPHQVPPTLETLKQMRSSQNAWPLEAERVSLDDPLMECLAIIASENGRRTTAVALSNGLPMPSKGLAPPQVFIRAAERVGMTARMVRRDLREVIKSPNMPCILILHADQACILKRRLDNETVEVLFPETPDAPVAMPVSELERTYNQYTFYVRARARMDERAGPSAIEEARDWFWSALKRHKKIYYEVAAAAVMINIFALASPLFTMNVYDRIIPNGEAALASLWTLSIGVIIVYVFDFLLKNLRSHFLDAAGRKADNVISGRIFEQMMAMKMAARPPSVGVLAANLREFETLRDFFTSATLVAIIDFPFALLFLLFIWLIAGPLALIPAVLMPLIMAMGIILQKPLQKVIKESMRDSAIKNSLIFETLSGLETIKAQAAEGHMQRKWEELTEEAARTNVKAKAIASFGINFAATMMGLCSIFMIIYGAYLINEQVITMGALIASVMLSSRTLAPFAQIAAILTKYSQSKEALERLNELMQSPVERPLSQTFISMPVVRGQIEFKDVLFRYPNQKTPALNGVQFLINPGEHVGIIGAVGSGKTTIERLIMNLYQPEAGSVQIDGVDVRQIDPADLRRNIGVVQQTPYLFYGTVRENITLGHETVPDSAVIRAAELSGVMSFLRDSEAGLDTQIGERGENLSGGQRQAIAIARALLYDPPIILLDEPTASIDPGSERRLYEHMKEITKGKTIVLITHKSAVLGLVDKLVLMDRGRIIAMGPRDDILYKLQTGQFRSAAKTGASPTRPASPQNPASASLNATSPSAVTER